jgi:peptidoglycan pentaglycine glycine transferase (the first glycine)
MSKHFVQSPEWGQFKTEYGTAAVRAGNVQYTKHHIPFTNAFFGYCPKVDPLTIDFEDLRKSLIANDCVNINFDVPNVVEGTDQEKRALEIFTKQGCTQSSRDQFARSNVVIDLTKSTEDLFKAMHHKHRYNYRYAEKNGVTLKIAKTQQDFDEFWDLFEATSVRQKYYVRPKSYYQTIWNMFHPKGIAHILTASYQNQPLASWLLFTYDNILYYPYGGSSEAHKNLFASTYLGWQVIKFGKEQGCTTFDMWGASDNPDDTTDQWWGFTNFKLKFGGQYVKYMHSYDFVTNPNVYKMFSVANDLRWKVLKLIK